MTLMLVMPDDAPERVLLRTDDAERIRAELEREGVRFERWRADAELAPGAGQSEVLAAYARDVERLMREGGYRSADVVRLAPDPSDPEGSAARAAGARAKFLAEHTHAEDEVRFFVEGRGLFYLHLGGRVLSVRCERGDLLSVPARTPHWFDMGRAPSFCAIRLFTNPDGWVASFTGDSIGERFPEHDVIEAWPAASRAEEPRR